MSTLHFVEQYCSKIGELDFATWHYIDEELLSEINTVIVKAGHNLLKKKMGPKLKR